jgi:hypothetical protein
VKEWEAVASYVRSRKRDLLRDWGVARARLASARGAHMLRPTALTRAALVLAMANIEVATALVEAWQNPGPRSSKLALPKAIPQT